LVPDEQKSNLFNDSTRRSIGDEPAFNIFQSVFDRWSGPFEDNHDYVAASLYFEAKTFLHGILVVEDKLSMAHSLETRVPFLDNELVDLALRVPISRKIRNIERMVTVDENQAGKRRLYEAQSSDGKVALREAMSRLVPADIIARTKQGFSAPDASWFRGESIDYIDRLLSNRRAYLYEFLSPKYVADILDEHRSGRANRRLLLWSLMSFEWWCRLFLAGVSVDTSLGARIA
jgi:asparagine synthase (glutamine-hydrolysing)